MSRKNYLSQKGREMIDKILMWIIHNAINIYYERNTDIYAIAIGSKNPHVDFDIIVRRYPE